MQIQNMASNDNTRSSNGNSASESSPSTSRLSSFKLPRDLTLGGSKAPPKKVFTPNLNVVRNKNKQYVPQPISNRNEQNFRGRFDRGRGRGTPRGRGSSVIKSSGIFSEGMAARERRIRSRGGVTGGKDSDGSQTVIEKPVLRVKSLWKIDKELEDMHIKELMNTEYSEQQEDVANDCFTPIRLPVSEGSSMYHSPKKVQDLGDELIQPLVKPELMSIKKEPGVYDDMFPPDILNIDKKEFCGKIESNLCPQEVTNLLQGNKASFLLLQLPDNLPGRGAESDFPRSKHDTINLEDTKAEKSNLCSLNQLEEGRIGKIIVHKSGKVKLQLGEIYFDLGLGTQSCFRQDVVSVNVDNEFNAGNMINLGFIQHKLTVIPDWEQMFPNL